LRLVKHFYERDKLRVWNTCLYLEVEIQVYSILLIRSQYKFLEQLGNDVVSHGVEDPTK